MLPIFIGLVSATLFGLVAHGVYGTETLIDHAWIDMVFWALIATGAAVSLANALDGCLPCRLRRITPLRGLGERLCRGLPCSH